MKRISVSFYDEKYQILEEMVRNNESSSVAQSVRELVDLGIKLREVAKNSDSQKNDDTITPLFLELKKLFKNMLSWGLETRLLARFLVENFPGVEQEKMMAISKQYKKTAQDYIEGLYEEKI